jgi:alpha-N-arabinofuranosidase
MTSQNGLPIGIRQSGFSLKQGEIYIISYWAKQIHGAVNGKTFGFIFCNPLEDGGLLVTPDCTPTSEWSLFKTEFVAQRNMEESLTLFAFTGSSTFLIDQISVMPKSWAENGGFRPDLLKAIEEIKPTLVRWPGGCFASAYRWKDGIGPQEKRGPYPFSIWDDREVNSFGTDEYIEMCRRVGCEPHIVINAGTPGWNAQRTPECADVDWVREACDWIEYCNGPATSTWGKVRAENGHPEPYDVKYWEIDNETQGGVTVDEYIAIIKKFVPAMKKIDPTIKIAVAGSHYGPREPWDNPIINEAGEYFNYISFHQYDDPNLFTDGPGKIESYFRELQKVIEQSPNKNIKIFDSEWNAQSTDWRTGLYCGGILNVFERCGDVVEIAAPALFLRHNTATAWDNAFVNFDNKSWYPAPNYVVMKLWHEHYAPIRIALDGDAKKLNVVATKSEDGKTFYLKAVNPTNEPCNVALNIDAAVTNASMKLVTANGLRDRNTLENPNAITAKDGVAKLDGNTIRFELPAYSAGVVTLK